MPGDSPRGCPASSFPTTGPDVSGLPDEIAMCSAKGCSQPASWALRWNNPKLHSADRRKIWLACADHKASLADFLSSRQFLRDVVPFRPSDTYPPSSEP